MDVKITQFNVQLYFREEILRDIDRLSNVFSESEGFSASKLAEHHGSHPMQNTMSYTKQGFKIGPVQSNTLPFKILQVIGYPNALERPDSETVECLHYVAVLLRDHLDVDIEQDIYAVRVVFHSIVTGNPGIQRVLSKITTLDGMPSVAGSYVGHKNPMDALQLTSNTGAELSQQFWNDIRISQFNANSYVVTIFNETDSLANAVKFIQGVKQFAATLMQEMEAASAAERADNSAPKEFQS